MDTEIGKPVNWDLPLMMRDGTPVQLVPGKFKFMSGQTRLLRVRTKLGYDKLVQCYENGLYKDNLTFNQLIINVPPTTQDAWVVKYADGSKRVLLTEPEGALIENPKLIKATLTYYDTP